MKANHLSVLLSGHHIGELERARSGGLRLTYNSDAHTPLSLSLSLPIAEGVHSGAPVENWIHGLLPDNDDALAAVERIHHVDRRDPLSLLAAIGKDCAGAVQFCPPDDIDATISRSGQLREAPDYEIEQRLSMMATDQAASWTMPEEHWSLGGTQQKFALRRHNHRWFFAEGSEPTTHIVKPGVARLREQALVEHVSMAAATRLGLDAAETTFSSFRSEDAIVVTRFDRTHIDGQLVRLHQEDLCQALGNPRKYEDQGGPSAADIITGLRDYSETAAEARTNVDKFVDGLIFNTIIGAPDGHARNYAVMLDERGPRLAPLFDVASGLAYDVNGRSAREVAMSVGGMTLLDQIDADAWRRFAGDNRLDEAATLERVRQLAELAPAAFESVLDEFDSEELRKRLLPPLRLQAATLARTAAAASSALPNGSPAHNLSGSAPSSPEGKYWRQEHVRDGHRVAGHWVRRPKR